MIIKSLELKNIRSYISSEEPILFDEGISLFVGDIYCGKSTILYAIEYALFGLGNFDGSFLLRYGTNKGEVTLKFIEKGEEYVIHRELIKKNNQIFQKNCYIANGKGQQNLPATDLKEKVLQILGFNEPPNPKAQSVIYRYAIFTPQDEIKEIIKNNPETRSTRLTTLRKIFRLEEYKIASNNCSILYKKIEKRIQELEIQTRDLKKIKSELNELSKTIKEFRDKSKISDKKKSKKVDEKKEYEKSNKKLLAKQKKLEGLKNQLSLIDTQNNYKQKILDDNKLEIDGIKKDIKTIQNEKEKIENIKKPTKLSIEELKNIKENLRIKIEETDNLKNNLLKSSSSIETINDNLNNTLKIISDLKLEIKNYNKIITEDNSIIQKQNKDIIYVEKDLDELKTDYEQGKNRIQQLEIKYNKTEHDLDKFNSLINKNICPTCNRVVEPNYFLTKKEDLNLELERLRKDIENNKKENTDIENLIKIIESNEELKLKIKENQQAIKDKEEKLKPYISNKEKLRLQIRQSQNSAKKIIKYENDLISLKNNKNENEKLLELLKEYYSKQETLNKLKEDEKKNQGRIKVIEKKNQKLCNEIQDLKNRKNTINIKIQDLPSINNELRDLNSKISKLIAELKTIDKEKIEYDTNMKVLTGSKKEKIDKIRELQNKRKIFDELNDYKMWLKEYFIPSIDNIERHVMESIRRKFLEQLQRWFEILIEDPAIIVGLDEDFTPEFKRDGFSLYYEQLSGGEKTSLALAYRLALNILVKEVLMNENSNMLILDEPTEGFSKEQLFKLRTIFRELNCNQIIIVSHERELESFADQIFKVERNNGTSCVKNILQ